MKKIVAILLVFAMTASVLTACGGGNDETKKETANDTAANDTEASGDADSESAADTEASTGDSDKLVMVTEAGFAPYEYTEDGTTVIGVDVDIANEIAKSMGKTLEIQNMNFDGALLAVQQGKADFAAAGISVTEDRQAVMDFTVEYATSKQVIVVNKSSDKVKSAEDITSDTLVGVQMGNVADSYCTDEM